MGIYEELRIKKIINCVSTATLLGGGLMHPEVAKAMVEASESSVSILELERRCCEIIADTCGAESALITTGGTGGLTLAFAASSMRDTKLVNYDPWKQPFHRPSHNFETMDLLQKQLYKPNEIRGIKTELVVPMGHECIWLISALSAGLKPIWAGTKEKCTQKQLENKITHNTAAIFFSGMMIWYYGIESSSASGVLSGIPPVITSKPYNLTLEAVIEVGHKHNIPIILDAAYTIPPVENLKKFINMGVDIACYCGGKSICGPNDTGFIVGRENLIKLAAFIRFPNYGLGRGMKIDKTQMVALTKALQLYPKWVDDNMNGAKKVAKWLVQELNKLPHIKSVERKIADMGALRYWPLICIKLNEDSLGITTQDVVNLLYDGDPCIWTYGPEARSRRNYCPNGITLNCQTIYMGTRKFPGNEKIFLKRFKEILTKKQ